MNIEWRKGDGDWWWMFDGYDILPYSIILRSGRYVVEFDKILDKIGNGRPYAQYIEMATAPTLKEAQDIAEVYMRMGIKPE